MTNKILFFGVVLSILSFKNYDKLENEKQLCQELTEMYKQDQWVRNLPELVDPYFEILDSIHKANNITPEVLRKLTNEENLEWGKIARKIADKRPKFPKNVQDSLVKIMIKIDRKNTSRLIQITKENGWINSGDLSCLEEPVWPAIIFRHSPKEFWKDIRILIEKENAEKRMNKMDYWLIDNHLKGRPRE